MNPPWAALVIDEIFRRLDCSDRGLSSAEGGRRLREHGRNELREQTQLTRLRVLAAQFRSPLLLLLVFAAGVAALSSEWIDAIIVAVIVLASAGLGFVREYYAQAAAAALRSRIRTRASALRDGIVRTIPIEEVVPGDIVFLAGGSLVPADAIVSMPPICTSVKRS